MRIGTVLAGAALIIGLAGGAMAQTASPSENSSTESTATPRNTPPRSHRSTSAKRDVGTGAADVGKGAAKGAGNIAAGTGRAAEDLVTLHPVAAASEAGSGAVKGGKDIGTGTAKGAGKMIRGAGKALKHVF